jgi:hypothetical protein
MVKMEVVRYYNYNYCYCYYNYYYNYYCYNYCYNYCYLYGFRQRQDLTRYLPIIVPLDLTFSNLEIFGQISRYA